MHYLFDPWSNYHSNPTRAENILEGRGCLGYLEARQAAQSLRRSLANLKANKHLPGHIERGIRRLFDLATEKPRLQSSGRSYPSPEQRYSWLEQAQDMMAEFYAQRSAPGRGIRRILPEQRDEIDPRLGHLYGPEYQTRSIAARRHNPRRRKAVRTKKRAPRGVRTCRKCGRVKVHYPRSARICLDCQTWGKLRRNPGPGKKHPRHHKLKMLEQAVTWLQAWGYQFPTIVWKWQSRSHDIEAYKEGKLYRFYVFRARRVDRYWMSEIAGKDICDIRTWPRVQAIFYIPRKGFFAVSHHEFKKQCGKATFNLNQAIKLRGNQLPRSGYFPRRRNPWSGKSDVERHNKKCAQYAECRRLWLRTANDYYKKHGDDGQAVIRANTAAKNWLKKHGKYSRYNHNPHCYRCQQDPCDCDPKYLAWLDRIDALLRAAIGMSHDELPADYMWADTFDAGFSPVAAINLLVGPLDDPEALREAIYIEGSGLGGLQRHYKLSNQEISDIALDFLKEDFDEDFNE